MEQSKLQFVEVTLEEILTGCTKQVPVTRDFTCYGNEETRMFEVPIEPGQKEGDQIKLFTADPQPIEVVFVVKEAKHEHFKRHGVNLHYTIHLTPQEATHRCMKYVPLLNQSQVKILSLNQRTTVRVLSNQGLPYPGLQDRRGDLIIYVVMDQSPSKLKIHAEEVKRVEQSHNKTKDFKFPTNKIQLKTLKSSPLEYQVLVTLKELLTGCVKPIQVERKYFDCGQLKKDDSVYHVYVKPGACSGSKIIFENDGNQDEAHLLAGDLVFVIQEIPHSRFTRQGHDLHYNVRISSATEMLECTLLVPLLDAQPSQVEVQVNGSRSVVRLAGFGLPHAQQSSKRGDLIVNFLFEKEV